MTACRPRRHLRALVVLGLFGAFGLACQQAAPPKQPAGVAGGPTVLAESAVLPVAEATKRCEAGEPRACVLLSRAFLRGEEIPRDLVKGVSLAREACEKGDVLGCAVFGQAELAGFVPGGDRRAGAARCQKACDASSGFGCRCIATAYGKGIAVDEDYAAALTYGTRSCDLGDAVGCGVAAAAQVKLTGTWVGEKTVALAKKGCDGGDDWSCALAASSVAYDERATLDARKAAAAKLDTLCDTTEPSACVQLAGAHQKGLLGAGDSHDRMKLYARKACEKDPKESCAMFATALLSGDRGEADLQLLGQLAQRGCEASDGLSCRWIGHEARARLDLPLARRGFEKGCALGDEASCVESIGLGVCASGDGVACRRALEPFCEGSKGTGCTALARLSRLGQGGPVDLPGALAYAKRGCERSFGLACVEVAGLVGLAKAPGWENEGMKALDRGCKEGGHGDACLHLGIAYVSAPKADSEKARRSFEDACRYGSIEGCGYHAATSLGMLPPFEQQGDLASAVVRASRACARGGGVGCWVEGRVLESGVPGVPANLVAALARYREACARHAPFGCRDAVKLVRAAQPKEVELVRGLLRAGCESGDDKPSCDDLAKLPPAPPPKPARPKDAPRSPR